MLIRDIMTTEVKLVHPDTRIAEAASVMKDFDIGALPVVDDGEPVGMVTDRDIAVRVVADGRDPKRTTVREALSQGIVHAYDDQSLEEAANLMQEHQVRRLPVLNRDKKLVGMVSMGDMALRGGQETAARVIEEVSKPSES
jgi:CBS domain-containing protein